MREGNKLYQDGDFDGSIEKYLQAFDKDPESDIINFNLGAGYYQIADYQKAIEHLRKSLLSDDENLQTNTYYNLGNALFKQGMKDEGQQNMQSAISNLEQSLVQYEQVLAKDQEDADAKFNHELVKKELERLRQKQQQQQNKDKKDREKKQEQQQQNQEQKQDQQENNSQEDQEQQEDSQSKDKREQSDDQEQKDESSQSKNSDDETNENQGSAGEQSPSDDSEKKSSSGGRGSQEMNKREAQMLLNDFQMEEAPGHLLNMMNNNVKESPVLKDW